MATVTEQLTTLKARVNGLQTRILAALPNDILYSILGEYIKFGCKVTQGSSTNDYELLLTGQADGDSAYANPDGIDSPTRGFHYRNIAGGKDGAIRLNDTTVDIDTAPATGTARYDIVYIFVAASGSGVGVATGTPSADVKSDFDTYGLDESAYGSATITDPVLPIGALPVARVYVEDVFTGIQDARIADLRAFLPAIGFSEAISAAEEWANKAEGSLISAAAGGDQVDDYSARHFAEKAKEYGEDWAVTPEDTLVPTDAGGNGVDEYSGLHYAAKAAASATTAEAHKNTAIANAAAAAASAASISDYSAIVQAISTNYNLADIQCVAVYSGEDSNGWERRTNLPYNNEDVPTGIYLGQFATKELAAADGDAAVGTWYYNTTDKYFYELTNVTPASEAHTRIYRAGSPHLPLARAAVVVGTGSSTRLIIFDLTQDGCPMWAEFGIEVTVTDVVAVGRYVIFATVASGVTFIDFAAQEIFRYQTAGLQKMPGSDWPNPDYSEFNTVDSSSDKQLPDNAVNSLATYTAPNAPVDQITGMAKPYILGGTNSGGFIVLPDSSNIQENSAAFVDSITSIEDYMYEWSESSNPEVIRNYSGRIYDLSDNYTPSGWSSASIPALSADSFTGMWGAGNNLVIAHADGLDLLIPNPNTHANSLIAKLGTNFNTGWMVKPLAAVMCDTDTGSIADTELVTNGTFDADSDWTKGDGWSIGSGVASSDGSQISSSNLSQSVTLSAGEYYRVDFTISNRSAGSASVSITNTGEFEITAKSADGTYTGYFEAPSASESLLISASSDFVGDVDDVTIKAVAADRSGQANHFDIVGTLTRTAVVTGGIAAYSGWSAANYLTSDDSDFDLDATAFSLPIAFKIGATTGHNSLISFGEDDTGKERMLQIRHSSGTLAFNINGDYGNTPGDYTDDEWHTAVVVSNAAGDDVKIYADGELVLTDTGLSFVAFTFSEIRIGLSVSGAEPCEGSLCLFAPSSVEWTPQQINKWHHDTMRLLESGSVTLPNTITHAYYDERNGDTVLLDSDSQEKRLNGLVITDNRDLDAGDAFDVGTVSAGAASGRARSAGGSTAVLLEVEAKNMREEHPRPQFEFFDVKYEADGSLTSFPDQTDADLVAAVAGCVPISVTDAGDKQTEGASADYTVEFDGFGYWVEFDTAPSNTNDVIVTFRREVRK